MPPPITRSLSLGYPCAILGLSLGDFLHWPACLRRLASVSSCLHQLARFDLAGAPQAQLANRPAKISFGLKTQTPTVRKPEIPIKAKLVRPDGESAVNLFLVRIEPATASEAARRFSLLRTTSAVSFLLGVLLATVRLSTTSLHPRVADTPFHLTPHRATSPSPSWTSSSTTTSPDH